MSSPEPNPRGLLLDLDGTIVDTLGFLFEAFRYALEPFVTRLPTDEEIVATFGPSEPECIARYLRQCEALGTARLPANEAAGPAADRFFEYYERGESIRAFPGMVDVIRLARRTGWRVGVFTGKGRRGAIYTLEQLNLWPYIGCLVSSDDVSRPKPDPEGICLALTQMDLRPDRLLFVGDAPADIAAGLAAQVHTAAALWGSFDRAATAAARPPIVCERVSDLRTLVEHPERVLGS